MARGVASSSTPGWRRPCACHSSFKLKPSAVRSFRRTRVCAEDTDQNRSPLEALPSNLAARFRARRSRKRPPTSQDTSEDVGRPSSSQDTETTGEVRIEPTRDISTNISDLWVVRSEDSDGAQRWAKADAEDSKILEEISKASGRKGLNDSTPSVLGGNILDGARRGKAKIGSFMDSIQDSKPMQSPAPRPISGQVQASRRTQDEEIRATRQQRMMDQGLTGAGVEGGWRTGNDANSAQSQPASPAAAESPDAAFPRLLRNRDSSDDPVDTEMRSEEYELQKEQRLRSQQAEIISTSSVYKPAVNTWGVFERPSNISAAYGGGRQLKPEDSVMSDEEQKEYDRQLALKLAQFRDVAGLTFDPEVAEECRSLTEQGKLLLDRGSLESALLLFEEASQLMNPKTDDGGNALLQKAITLDSLGRHDAALKLYGQLVGHRCSTIAKTAKSMSFGFRAGEFLKADTISYAATKEEYDPFFSALGGKWGWDTVYVASDEDKKESNVNNTLLFVFAATLVLAPLAWVYVQYLEAC